MMDVQLMGQRVLASMMGFVFAAFVMVSMTVSGATAQPAFNTAFSPSTIGPGGTSTLTYTIDNSFSSAGPTDLAFTNVLPAGMTLASPASGLTTCSDATLSAPSGGAVVTFSGGKVGLGSSCTVSVNVTAATQGTYTNTTGDLTSSHGNSGSSSFDLVVDSGQPGFSKSFSPSSVSQNGTSILTYTIDNSANGSGVQRLNFTETLPVGLEIAAVPNASTTCGTAAIPAVLTAAAGTQTIELNANGFLPSFPAVADMATCTVSLAVKATAAGDLVATSGDLQASFVPVGSSTATLTSTVASLHASKSFVTNPVAAGNSTVMRVRIDNFSRASSATGVGFLDNLDSIVSGAVATGLPASVCGGGTLSGTSMVTLSGGTIAPESFCTFDVTVSIPGGVASGAYTSTAGAVSATVGGTPVTGNMASAPLTVQGADQTGPTLSMSISGPVANVITTSFTLTNNSTGALTDGAFLLDLIPPLPFPVTVSGTTPTEPCGVGSAMSVVHIDTDDQGVQLTGGTLAASGSVGDSCTFSVDITLPDGFPGNTYSMTPDAPTAMVGGITATGTATGGSFTVGGGLNMSATKVFSAAAAPGGTSTLTITLSNGADSAAASAISFSDDLSAMLTGATATTVSNSCNGSVADGSTLSLTGGTLAAGTDCTVVATVSVPAGAAIDSHTNTISDLSATPAGGSAQTLAEFGTDLVVAGLSFEKEFIGDPVIAGNTLSLRYTITNVHPTLDATLAFFTDSLSGVMPGFETPISGVTTVNTCGGALSGTTFLIYVGGGVTAGNSCTIELEVAVPVGAADGRYNSTSSYLAVTQGGAVSVDPAVDMLNVESNNLVFSKAFNAASGLTNSAMDLTFTLENPTNIPVTAAAFTDDLDAFFSGTTVTAYGADTCGGTPTGTGSGTFGYSAGTIPANGSCSIAITTLLGPVAGTYTNTSSALTGSFGGLAVSGDAASDELQVFSASGTNFSSTFTASVEPNGTTGMVFSMFNLSTTSLTNMSFNDDLDAMLSGTTVTSVASNTCGGTPTGVGSGVFGLAGGALAAGDNCSVSINIHVADTAVAGSYTNTSGKLFENGVEIAPVTSAILTVDASPVPGFSKAFSAASIAQGDTSTLTYTINNTALVGASALAFSEAFSSGMTLAATPNASTTCTGGSVTAVGGASSMSFASGTVAASSSCTVSMTVTSVTVGANVATSGALTSNLGNSGTAGGTLTVTAAPVPGFTAAFSATSIAQGGVNTLTYTINNTALIGASALAFSDFFSTGMTVAATPSASTTCTGGSVTAVAGAGSMSFASGSVAASGSCTVSVNVTSQTIGVVANTSGTLSSNLGTTLAASAGFSVTAAPVPGFSKAFSAGTIAQGGVDTLTFTVNNTALIGATTLAFSDTFPTGMSVAATPSASTTCTGGSVSAVAGAGSMSFASGTVAASSSCTVSLNVTSATVGAVTNTSGTLSSNLGISSTASAGFSVTDAPIPGFSKAFSAASIAQGDVSTLTFTINNTALIGATSLSFSDTFPSGMVIAPTPNNSSTCVGGMGTFTAGAASMSYAGGAVAAGTSCIVRFDVTSQTVGVVTNTSSILTSNLRDTGTASAGFTVTAAPVPGFSKAFSAGSIVQGGVDTLTFTVNNTALIGASALAFSDTFPTGMTVAATPNASTTCTGGAVSAVAGAGSMSFASGTVGASATCTVSLNVTSATLGAVTNTSGTLSSNLGTSSAASAGFTVTAAPVPVISKSFAPASIAQGGTSTLSMTVNNSSALVAAENISLVDNLPTGMSVAAVPNVAISCSGVGDGSGIASGGAGATTVSVTSGTIDAQTSCTASFDVTSTTVGAVTNTTQAVTLTHGGTAVNAGTASAGFTVTAAPAPEPSKAFSPSSIVQGDVSTLTFTFDNLSALIAATGVGISDTLPTGMTVATTPNASTTCTGGTITATAGAGVVSYAGGTIAASGSCTLAVDVTSATLGTSSNTSGLLTSDLGNSTTMATADLMVTAAPVPGFSKAFGVSTMAQGAVTSLTFTVNNTALIGASALAFSDTFPSGMTVAATPNASTTCTGGAVSAVAGAGSMSFASGTVEASSSCTVSLNVQAVDLGAANNVSGALSSNLGTSGTASASVTVTAAPVPGFSKAFGSSSLAQGTDVSLTFTINNTALIGANTLAFSDNFPSGMTVASTPTVTNSCGGSVTAAAGTSSMSFSGGSVGAASSCTIGLLVTSATVGSVTNTSGDLTSDLGNSGTASANVEVTQASAPGFTKAFSPSSVAQGAVSTLTFSIDNAGSAVDASGLNFSDTFPRGMVVAETPNASTTCTGGAVTGAGGASSMSFASGTATALNSCTVSIDVVVPTAVGNYDNTSGALGFTFAPDVARSGTTASATLTVTAAPVPTFTKSFDVASFVQGGTSVLTLTINNTALIEADDVAFVDSFPTGMSVAATPGVLNTCNGSVTATAGAGSVSLSGGEVDASTTCTVSVNVTSSTIGSVTNTTGDLTSDLGNSGTASATVEVTSAPTPGFAKAFSPDTIAQGDVSTLTFTIDNAGALIDVTGLAFGNTFPSNMTVATTPSASSTCTGGTITATAGAASMSYAGGTVSASGSCTVSVNVSSTTIGANVSTSGSLASSQGTTAAASATLTVTAAALPTFAQTLAPSSMTQGDVSTLTFTIDNASAFITAGSLAFTNNLPASLSVASTPNLSNSCGGSVSASSAASTLSLSGGSVGAALSCVISVDVTSTTVGSVTNTTGDLTSDLGNSGSSSATLSVTAAPVPGFSLAFAPDTIIAGGVSTLTYSVDNSSAHISASAINFRNTFPSGVSVATTPNASTTCGGTVLATAGAGSVGFSGGSVAASSSCTVTMDVTSSTVGAVTNTSDAMTSNLGSSGTATGGLTVNLDPMGRLTIVQLSDVDGAYGFTSSESLLNFTINTTSGAGQQGPISLNAGTYTVAQSRPTGVGNANLTCSDSDSIGISATGALSIVLGNGENVTCTYSSVDSATPSREAIGDFLTRRVGLLLSNEPSSGRRLNRLKGGVGGTQVVSFNRGNLKSLMPVNFDLKTLGSDSYHVSGSLSEARAAFARMPLSLDGSPTDTARVDNTRWDVWFEAAYSRFEGSQDSSGSFGVGYIGADYLVSQDLLVGFLVQFDSLEDTSITNNRKTDGHGWMAGPYVTARLGKNLYFDGRVAIGKSRNTLDMNLNGLGTLGRGEFETTRWLINASLTGEFDLGTWKMAPNLSLSYMEETQKAFVDSLNVTIAEQTVSQGQIRFGPNFSTRVEGKNGVVFQPSVTLDAIYTFGTTKVTSATSTSEDGNGLRARLEAGVSIAGRNGARVDLKVNYDGIGASSFESYGASLKVAVPF